MNKDEAREIILVEKLENYNLNENRTNRENEVGLKFVNDKWIVYATDERASVVTGSCKEFDSEGDALANFIKRLRADKILRQI